MGRLLLFARSLRKLSLPDTWRRDTGCRVNSGTRAPNMVDASPTPSNGSPDSQSAPSIIDLCKAAVAAHPSWARGSVLPRVPYELVETAAGNWSLGPSQRLIARQLTWSRIFTLLALLILSAMTFWLGFHPHPTVRFMFRFVGLFMVALLVIGLIVRQVSFSFACRKERAAGPKCVYSRGQRAFQFPRVSDEWIDAGRVGLYAISISHYLRYEAPRNSATTYYSFWTGMCAVVDQGHGQPVCHVVLQTKSKRKRDRLLSAWKLADLPPVAICGEVCVEERTNSPSAVGAIGN